MLYDEKYSKYVEVMQEFEDVRNKAELGLYGGWFVFFLSLYMGYHMGVIVWFLGIFLAFTIANYNKDEFFSLYKTKLVPKIINELDNNLTYFPNRGFSREKFEELNIIKNSFTTIKINRYHTEDRIEGTLEDTKFAISEVYAARRGDKKTVTIFNGEVFEFQFKQKFKTPLYIVPDLAQTLFGRFGKSLQRTFTDNLVILENPEFEKIFKVTCANEIYARYILTPKFMERLVDISKKSKKSRIFIECRGDMMYLLIENYKDKFAPSVRKGKIFKDMEQNIKDIQDIVDSVNLLSINTHHTNINAL
jgi:hypothetical protein